ncbi:GMC oxidoreductase [Actinomadura luteofluorescens]|uniref:GMC oxidoreductase n=1 Tax=Actinomadura luteofluorescens TaxID=46163 RepID=UPI0036431A51
MGDHPGEGVCDAFGEVFGFPGLYIADGAAMPGPVGPNPSLTIAAQADRLATRLLEETSARRGAGGPTAPPATGAELGRGALARRGGERLGVRPRIGESRRNTGTVHRGRGPYVAVVHRGDEGVRHLRRDRHADRRAGGRAPAPVVPPDDHRGGHRPVPGRTGPRGDGHGVGRRHRARGRRPVEGARSTCSSRTGPRTGG